MIDRPKVARTLTTAIATLTVTDVVQFDPNAVAVTRRFASH